MTTQLIQMKGGYYLFQLLNQLFDLAKGIQISIFYEKSYWKVFYENLKCNDGVYEFIKWLKNNNIDKQRKSLLKKNFDIILRTF